MNEATIKKIIKESLKEVIDEVQNCKRDLKTCINSSETRLLKKLEESNHRITLLETENTELKEKLEYLDRENRSKSLIIFGLNKSYKDITLKFITEKIDHLLGVKLKEDQISNFFALGKTNSAPLKIELTSAIKKKEIIQNKKKLRGTGFSISEDLTLNQREHYKQLKENLVEIKQSGKYKNSYIKGIHLVLDGKKHTLEDLSDIESKSEESTPTSPSAEQTGSPPIITSIVSKNQAQNTLLNTNKNSKTKNQTNAITGRTTRFGSSSNTLINS